MKTVPVVALLILVIASSSAWSHCQVPCGIYNDEMRLELMGEHIMTLEKSMQQIIELSKSDTPNANQIIRWVNNKDDHADELIHIVTWYFMNQRIKPVPEDSPDYADYVDKLTLLHEIMVYSMKAKQSTDLENVDKLQELLREFSRAYLGG